jgi:HEAT repeat protein
MPLLGFIIVLAISGCSSGATGTDMSFMPTENEITKVQTWLAKAPFDDPSALAAQPNFSYEAWFSEGRALPHAPEILAQLLQKELSRPTGNGERIAYALGWLGDKRSVGVLKAALESKDAVVRSEAVAALGRVGDADVFPVLKKLAEDEREDANVRANACISIGRIAPPGAEPMLRLRLADKQPFVARAAAEALRLAEQQRSH